MLPELTEAAAAAALSSSAWQLHRRAAERTAAGARVLMLTLGAPDTPAPAVAVEAAVAALRSDTPALWCAPLAALNSCALCRFAYACVRRWACPHCAAQSQRRRTCLPRRWPSRPAHKQDCSLRSSCCSATTAARRASRVLQRMTACGCGMRRRPRCTRALRRGVLARQRCCVVQRGWAADRSVAGAVACTVLQHLSGHRARGWRHARDGGVRRRQGIRTLPRCARCCRHAGHARRLVFHAQ
jgi:hypothetical protein